MSISDMNVQKARSLSASRPWPPEIVQIDAEEGDRDAVEPAVEGRVRIGLVTQPQA